MRVGILGSELMGGELGTIFARATRSKGARVASQGLSVELPNSSETEDRIHITSLEVT